MDIVKQCEMLADWHGGIDLPERVRHAFEVQSKQRVALAHAADELRRLRARIAELEHAGNCKPDAPAA